MWGLKVRRSVPAVCVAGIGAIEYNDSRPVRRRRRPPMLIFRPLFDPTSSTWTYLLGDRDSGEAVLIDPVFEQLRRDQTLIRELGLTLKWTLETHVHADHVTGA